MPLPDDRKVESDIKFWVSVEKNGWIKSTIGPVILLCVVVEHNLDVVLLVGQCYCNEDQVQSVSMENSDRMVE